MYRKVENYMKRFVVGLFIGLLILFLASSVEAQNSKELATVAAVKWMTETFAKPETIADWRDGLVKDGLELVELKVYCLVNKIHDVPNYYVIEIIAIPTAYCKDRDGLWTRVVRNMKVLIAIKKETLEITDAMVQSYTELKKLDGWNGKNI